MNLRPCIKCGTPTKQTRCPTCTPPSPTYQDNKQRATLTTQHRNTHGNQCPGYQTPPHQLKPGDRLTADHITPQNLQTGGGGELRVLCQACNSRRTTHEGQGTPTQPPRPG